MIEDALFPYLEKRHAGAVLRSKEPGAVVMVPPWASSSGKWTLTGTAVREPQHSVEEVNNVLRNLRAP